MNKKIYFKPYMRKNGNLMLYINCYDFFYKQQTSLAVAEYIKVKDLSKGQYKLFCAWQQALELATPFIANFVPRTSTHNDKLKEPCVSLDEGKILLLITDIAKVFGVPVPQDGLYFIFNNNLYTASALKNELERIINE